jgi:hypothetical protein
MSASTFTLFSSWENYKTTTCTYNEDEDFLFIGSREPCAVIAGPQHVHVPVSPGWPQRKRSLIVMSAAATDVSTFVTVQPNCLADVSMTLSVTWREIIGWYLMTSERFLEVLDDRLLSEPSEGDRDVISLPSSSFSSWFSCSRRSDEMSPVSKW